MFRLGNFLVGLLQVAGMLGCVAAAWHATTPGLWAVFTVLGCVSGAMGGRMLAVAVCGSERDQVEA